MPGSDIAPLLERIDALGREVIAPVGVLADREARWPEESIRALMSAGLGGLVVRVEASGLGKGLAALAAVCERIARYCPSTALCYGMHCVAAATIQAKATPDQRLRYLEPIALGVHVATLALSEPGTGAAFYIPQTELLESPGPSNSFIVRGTKSFVTNGAHADSYVVSVVHGRSDAATGKHSVVLLPKDAEGMEWGGEWTGVGMRANSSRTLNLRDVAVPRRDLLGEEGDQEWYVFEVVAPFFLMAMAGTYLGIAESALEEAREHLLRRVHAHTGARLADQTLLQHRMGELFAKVQRTRALIGDAAARADAHDESAMPALLACKAEVAATAVDVVNGAMTLVGGIGYREGARLERLLRDSRAADVMAPTTDLLRIWTGRAVLGLPIL